MKSRVANRRSSCGRNCTLCYLKNRQSTCFAWMGFLFQWQMRRSKVTWAPSRCKFVDAKIRKAERMGKSQKNRILSEISPSKIAIRSPWWVDVTGGGGILLSRGGLRGLTSPASSFQICLKIRYPWFHTCLSQEKGWETKIHWKEKIACFRLSVSGDERIRQPYKYIHFIRKIEGPKCQSRYPISA